MPWSVRSMSETILQWTGSPTSTGTIWLTDGITGRPAAAMRRFRLAARSWWVRRTSSWALRYLIEASAPADRAGGSEVVKMKPDAWERMASTRSASAAM